jgi:hypothetical protein
MLKSSNRRVSLPNVIARILSLLCGVVVLVIALAGNRLGYSHGFDRWLPEGVEYENVKVAAAISDLVYGTNKGRVADARVYNELRMAGVSIYPQFIKPINVKFPENLSDADLLNRAFERAAHLQGLSEPKKIITELKPVEPNDLGAIDFYRWAFELFGLRVQSFYKLYTAIHFASIGLFIWVFWRRLDAMVALLIVVSGHYLAQVWIIVGSEPSVSFNVGTSYSQRVISVLGLISALHVALEIFRPPQRPGFANVAAFIGQSVIVLFVATIRRSAIWEVLWPASLALGFLAVGIVRARLTPRGRRLTEPAAALLQRGLSWPALTLTVVFIGFNVFQFWNTSPIFRFSDESLPQHMFWHSAYLGLEVNPDWWKRYGKQFVDENGQLQTGDAMPIWAARKFLQDNYALPYSYLISPIWGLKYRTTERVLREAYFDFLLNHPRFALELQLFYKPAHFVKNFVLWNQRTLPALSFHIWVVVIALSFAVAAYLGWVGDRSLGPLTGVLLVAALWAVIPSLLTFANGATISDAVLTVDATLAMAALWALAQVVQRVRYAEASRRVVPQAHVTPVGSPNR